MDCWDLNSKISRIFNWPSCQRFILILKRWAVSGCSYSCTERAWRTKKEWLASAAKVIGSFCFRTLWHFQVKGKCLWCENGITTEGFSCVNFPFACAIVGLNTAASLCGLNDGKPSSEIWLVQFQIACLPSFQFPFPNALYQPLTRYTYAGFKERFTNMWTFRLANQTSAASLLSLRLVTSQLERAKSLQIRIRVQRPWGLVIMLFFVFAVESSWCAAPPHLPQAVGAWHDVWLLRAAVAAFATRSQGDKRQINHVSPPTLCFSPAAETFFSLFFSSLCTSFESVTPWRHIWTWQRHRAADRAGAIFGSTWFSCRLTLLPVTPCLYCEMIKSANPKSADAAVPDLFKCIWLTPHTHTSTQSLFKCGRALNLGKHFLQSGRSHEALSHMDLYTSSQPFLRHGPVSQVKARYRVVDRIPQG